MTSEALLAAKMSLLVFWEVTPCRRAGRYLRFSPEDEATVYSETSVMYLRLQTALQLRRPAATAAVRIQVPEILRK